jgi:spore germination protein GerM
MRGLVYIGLMWVIVSCTINGDDYDIESISAEPELVFPLATGKLSIHDLLDKTDSAYVRVYSGGLVYLKYDAPLTTQNINNLVSVPNLPTLNRSVAFPPGTYGPSTTDVESTISTSTVDMGISPEKLTEIAFKAGQINYTANLVPPNANVQYSIRIEIPEFVNAAGNGLNQVVNNSGNIPLTGFTFKGTTSNSFTLKLILIIRAHTNTYVIAPGTQVTCSINYTQADYTYVKGFFGDQIASPNEQSLNIGTFGDFLADGNVSFADAKINFDVSNDYGVPVELVFETLRAIKNGSNINIVTNPANPIPINAPVTLGASANTTIAVSNATQVIDFGPEEFYFKVHGHVNRGLTSGNNFLVDTSKMRVRLNIELPLYGQASNIEISDTTELDLSDIDASTIESAEIKASIKNELPLDGILQLYLLDENDVLVDAILPTDQTHLLVGSTVTADGSLQSAGTFDEFISLDKTKLNKLFSAKKMVIAITLNTSRNASGNPVDVKFTTNLRMDVKIGLKAKAKVKVGL